ncbi:MAG: hypothetical protein ACRC14_04560 [Paracoccaceae bacterium]
MSFARSLALAALTLAVPNLALAGTLEGRIVTLNVMTTDTTGAVVFESRGRTVTVGAGVEFDMGPEHLREDLDVVPVQVEIGPQRIAFSYGEGQGSFFQADFNGYVLRFATECALFEAVQIDQRATTMAVDLKDVRVEGGALFVNVAGREFGPDATLALDFVIGDCVIG